MRFTFQNEGSAIKNDAYRVITGKKEPSRKEVDSLLIASFPASEIKLRDIIKY